MVIRYLSSYLDQADERIYINSMVERDACHQELANMA